MAEGTTFAGEATGTGDWAHPNDGSRSSAMMAIVIAVAEIRRTRADMLSPFGNVRATAAKVSNTVRYCPTRRSPSRYRDVRRPRLSERPNRRLGRVEFVCRRILAGSA